ncbi:MAG: hypothetical protein A2075_11440 [Geobacteraceae bacterium GWC2_58_44]|nr:MAG: hypothetical protein A2075_11440 [Geobacteraceae bacterium GWC2_58_44]
MFPDISAPKKLLPALFLLALLAPAPLKADELIVTPAFSVREEYNDNVFAQSSDRRRDFITTLSPVLTVSNRNERVSANLSGGVNSLHYLRNSSGSALGYFVRGTGSYTAAPRLSLSSDLGYLRDSSASSIDPATSLVVSSRSERQSYRLGGRYALSEMASSSVGLAYSRDDYDSQTYLDTWHYQGNAGIDYDPGSRLPRTKLGSLLTLRRDATDLSRVDSLSATLGVTRELSELWRLSLNGGARFTRSEFHGAGGAGRESHDESGGVGSLALAYSGEKLSGSLALSHDLNSASGRGGATKVTGANLTVAERFTRDLSGSLAAAYVWNRSDPNEFALQPIDERSRNLTGSLRYQIADAPSELSLEARYSYNNTQNRLLGTEMVQNIFMLRLNWQYPMFR